MDKIELSKHIKHGDTFYTPFTDPSGLGATLCLSSWAKCWLPEFLWIGLIIKKQGRKKGLESLYLIIEDLKHNSMAIPQFSKIFGLSEEQQKIYWSTVTRHVERNILMPLTVVITPDVNEIFYDFFFDFSMNVDDNIAELLDIIKETNGFHDELSTDICFIVDWFYVLNGKLLYVMLYFFKRIYSIKLYISVEVNNIFMCSQMLSFTGKIKEKIILGKIS